MYIVLDKVSAKRHKHQIISDKTTYKSREESSYMENSSLLKTAATYSPTNAVPSARSGLTSLFGMGRGGTPTL